MRPGARCALVLAAAMVVAAPYRTAAQSSFGVIAGLNRANFTAGVSISSILSRAAATISAADLCSLVMRSVALRADIRNNISLY